MTHPQPIPSLAADELREASVTASYRAQLLAADPQQQDLLRQAARQWAQLERLITSGALLPKQWTREHLVVTEETARRGGYAPATLTQDVLALLYPTRR